MMHYYISVQLLRVRELLAYLAAASSFIADRSDIGDFTEKVLGFWRSKGGELPTFARTARIIYAIDDSYIGCVQACVQHA